MKVKLDLRALCVREKNESFLLDGIFGDKAYSIWCEAKNPPSTTRLLCSRKGALG